MTDAHCHLQHPGLAPFRDSLEKDLQKAGVTLAIVNATRESDWQETAALCAAHPRLLRPAFGLHPWHLAERTPRWLDRLGELLDRHPRASLGECGLDRWMRKPDLPLQRQVLRAHLRLARERALPVTLHCLRAWGGLLDLLRGEAPLPRGFLLHAFGGPPEMIPEFAQMGAFFSFSPSFLRPGKEKKRDGFLRVPPNRLLFETDAPHMPPPDSLRLVPGVPNHPANLPAIVQALAPLLGDTPENLAHRTTANALRLFGNPSIQELTTDNR